MTTWFRTLRTALCLLAIPLAVVAQPRMDSVPTVPVQHWNFSTVDKDAQIWSGMYIASNNKIYIGLSTHADAANVYEFDIAAGKMRHLANQTILLGERGRGIWTNGKIHVQMQERNGYVYYGTLCEDNGPPAIDASSYEGPWWFRIRMDTGAVEPLSKINKAWGLVGQTMDEARGLIYGLAEDGHLYRYHIDDNYTEDLGRTDSWDICRTIFIDDAGNVYGSYPPGLIWKYDIQKERMLDLPYLRLPIINTSRSMANPMLDRKSQWRIIEWDPHDKVAYGIVGGTNILFKYDVHAGREGEITELAMMCAPPYRTGDYNDIPYASLTMTISQKERKIYYMPVLSSDFDYQSIDFKKSRKSGGINQGDIPPLSFLVSYDLKTGERKDLGLLQAEDGRMAYGMGGAHIDNQGRLWFVGAFEEPDKQYVVSNMDGKYPYSLGLGCYDPMK